MDPRDDDSDEESKNKSDFNSDPGVISRMGLNDNKAGMQGLDKEKINKIILENSIGSKFYENERKKDAQVNARIQKLLEQVDSITPAQKDSALGKTNEIIQQLEKTRDLSRTIVHIDMDAFYASVEERDRPELKDKPMAVGGMGMLSTSNYVARRYGVRAAMPGFIGKKLCPDLILVPMNFPKYTEVSHQVRQIFSSYDPNFVPMSLDEAYLDITSYLEKRKTMPEEERTFTVKKHDGATSENSTDKTITFGVTAQEVVKEIRFKIEQETRLTASAGIASNTLLSKVASDMNKPNGQYYLTPTREAVMDFTRKLPIRKVGGIGKVTEKLLNTVGVHTCQDLYDQRAILYLAFSEISSNYFLRVAMGISSTTLENDSERKSISTERTFREISDPSEMYRKCEELCESLEEDAKKENIRGSTVTLKIKTASFELHTRSKTLLYPVCSKSEIYPIIADLLKQELALKKQLKLRLIGVGLSKLTKGGNEPQQKSLNYFLQKANERKPHQKSAGTVEQTGNETLEIVDDTEEKTALNSTTGSNFIVENSKSTEESIINPIEGDTEVNEESASKISIPLTNDGSDKKPTPLEFNCPVCGNVFNDLSVLNQHIDRCAVTGKEKTGEKIDDDSKSTLGGNQENNNYAVNWNNDVTCLTCPICNATFCCHDISLDRFNTHVDSCLNRKTIRELVKSESDIHHSQQSTSKRTHSSSGPPKKRQKISKPPSCTLDKFFK